MRALWFFQTLISCCQSTWHNIPEDQNLQLIPLKSNVDDTSEATAGTDCSCDASSFISAVLIFCHIILFILIQSQNHQSFIPELHSETDQWREAVRQVLLTLPDPNICLLRYLLLFLRHYEQHSQRTQCHHLTAGGVAPVFVPLLIHGEVEQGRKIDILQKLMSKLIHECGHILQER